MKIEIKNLTKVYGEKSSALLALSELELEVFPGEILIIKGPNGSGKSTLVSILSGELDSTVGQILVKGNDDKQPKIAVIKQFENLIQDFSIAEHFKNLKNSENIELIPSEILNSKPDQISRGEAQQVAVALALTKDTDLFLADEPTGALGSEESKKIYEFIRSTAKRNNTAVLLVTHDKDAEAYADRIVQLKDGRVGEVWQPNSVQQQLVSNKGWVRIPDDVRASLASSVQIKSTSEGAIISGSASKVASSAPESKSREIKNVVLLEVSNLTTGYDTKVVSRNLNFKVQQNELFCVFGKSGIGKTTLLKTICGLLPKISGEISGLPKQFIPYFNVETPYALELTLNDLATHADLISELDLTSIANRPLKTFSGGQLQRALIAIALSKSDEIIALDEPTSALDDQMCDLVISVLAKSNKTIIASSHDPRLSAVASKVFEL